MTNQPRSGLRELPGTSSWSRCFQGVRAAGVRGRGGQGPRLRCGRAPRRHRLRVRPASCFPGTTPCSRRLTSGTSNLTATLTPPLTGEDTEHRESKELPTGRTAVRGEGESEPAAPPRGRAPRRTSEPPRLSTAAHRHRRAVTSTLHAETCPLRCEDVRAPRRVSVAGQLNRMRTEEKGPGGSTDGGLGGR